MTGKHDLEWRVNQDFLDKIFIHVYCDLGERSSSEYIYHRLNCARLLRQLIVDGQHSLLSQVNRNYKLDIAFIVPSVGPKPASAPEVPEQYIQTLRDISDFPPGFYYKIYRIGEYLSHQLMGLADESISVRDVIKYVSDHYGGVHLAPYVRSDRRTISRFQAMLKFGSEDVVMAALNNVIQTTLFALSPLKQAIEIRMRSTGDFPPGGFSLKEALQFKMADFRTE